MKMGRSRRQNLRGGWFGTAAKAGLGMILPMLGLWAGFARVVLAQVPESTPSNTQRETVHCPPQDLSALVTQLMLDLPSYSNRVIQRASKMGDSTPLYLMLAGQAEISPVSLEAMVDDPNRSRLPADGANRNVPAEEIYQIFFTTLERQYGLSSVPASSTVEQLLNQAAPSFQQFHWLILARHQGETTFTDASPWRIISLRSQLTSYPHGDAPLAPARDSRPGPVGQGIVIWLRDWHSGAIRLNAANLESSAVHATESNSPCLNQ